MRDKNNIFRSDTDGTWHRADAIPMQGWKAKCEEMFRMWRLNRLANFMARWDERGLGK